MFAGKPIEYFSDDEAVGIVDCEAMPKFSQAFTTFMDFVFGHSKGGNLIFINKFGA